MSLTVGAAKQQVTLIEQVLRDTDGLKAKVSASFVALDLDKSGHLCSEESKNLINNLCTIMGLPRPTAEDYVQHQKLLDADKNSQLSENEVGAGIVGAMIHKVGSLKHFLSLAEAQKLDDSAALPSK